MSVNHISIRVEAAFNFRKKQVKAALGVIARGERLDILVSGGGRNVYTVFIHSR